MDIIIRNVRKEDLPSVVDIKIKGWQVAYKGIVDDTYLTNLSNERETRIAKMEKNYMTNGFIVAELDNEVVGFCRYIFDNSFSPEIDDVDCELCAIYVKPDLKRQGIGKELFNYVIQEQKKNNNKNMILWCLKENSNSRKFYEKMGGNLYGENEIEMGGKKYKKVGYRYDLSIL